MNNTFGKNLKITLFGESHGPAIGVVIDGLPAGVKFDMAYIMDVMDRRKAYGKISTPRREADIPDVLSGVNRGYTQGTPIMMVIGNEDVRRSEYEKIQLIPRPGHADYTGHIRYRGYEDASGGGHFSGRLTAPLTAAGAVCLKMLADKGITIGTHIRRLADIEDDRFDNDPAEQIRILNSRKFAVISEEKGKEMIAAAEKTAAENDSLGGLLETAVCGLEAGIGEPFFDSLESVLSHALFSIPGVKGVLFGAGMDFASMKGSQANDQFGLKDGRVVTLTNNSGGINGGISNGMPLLFTTVIRPTPSIARPQQSVNLDTMQETVLQIKGRHDPVIIHRARVVADCVTAIVLADMLMEVHGSEWFAGEVK